MASRIEKMKGRIPNRPSRISYAATTAEINDNWRYPPAAVVASVIGIFSVIALSFLCRWLPSRACPRELLHGIEYVICIMLILVNATLLVGCRKGREEGEPPPVGTPYFDLDEVKLFGGNCKTWWAHRSQPGYTEDDANDDIIFSDCAGCCLKIASFYEANLGQLHGKSKDPMKWLAWSSKCIRKCQATCGFDGPNVTKIPVDSPICLPEDGIKNW